MASQRQQLLTFLTLAKTCQGKINVRLTIHHQRLAQAPQRSVQCSGPLKADSGLSTCLPEASSDLTMAKKKTEQLALSSAEIYPSVVQFLSSLK